MHQIPCRDLVQAHCLRSWLLSHEIQADVVHENGSWCFTPFVIQPQILVADEDVPRVLEAAQHPDPEIDESFSAPVADEPAPEQDTPRKMAPSLFGMAMFGAAFATGLGVLVLLLQILLAVTSGGLKEDGRSFSEKIGVDDRMLFIVPAGGAAVGVLLWLVLLFARGFHDDRSGLSLGFRWMALFLLLFFSPLALIFSGFGSLFRYLLQVVQAPSF